MQKLLNFFREVRVEMAKVVWPTGRQLTTYTLIVILLSVLLALFLGALDLGFQTVLTKYILR
ncbi:MAG: preprotein translocase subunit SecE [Candidatus Yanofskybacteria bacterium RIFCSPHIGHO2_01_FULL_41_21]|uniref:Protein translocase subunit SecE n=1 Tax=Candidatus Yanofskybacteria bacterium RIFCSPHIGHO2_01_FULL_41_21 TaxID=1802660 RepID=A0A1F8EAG4_9BACT|nr:MAG: preprotein translocase subunit SecE [Candidatus Yanofskybacteria bacterium RIFCSPHIGHO2_01_FULL_41_21]